MKSTHCLCRECFPFISQLRPPCPPPPPSATTKLKADQEFERCKHSFGKHQSRLSLALYFLLPFFSFFHHLLNRACTHIELLAFVPEALKVL